MQFELAQSLILRRYKEGDEKSIVKLKMLCSDTYAGKVNFDYWLKHWVWKYKENPLGKRVWVAEHNGQIVAYTGLVRANVKIGKNTFRSIILTDLVVHHNFRGRGLPLEMYAIVDSELVKAGIHLSYWFPGEYSYKQRRRGLDYDMCKIPSLMKFLDTNEILRKMVRSRRLAKGLSVWLNPVVDVCFGSKKKSTIEDVQITKITQFDDRINDFWKDVSKHFDIIVVRNRECLNWRYFQRPQSNFRVLLAEDDEKILGYIVFSPKNEKGLIADLLVYPHRLDVIQRLVLMAVEQLREEKVHRITCRLLGNMSYYRALRTNGFIPAPKSKYPFEVAIYSPSNVPTEFVTNPKNWYLTYGDTDSILQGN